MCLKFKRSVCKLANISVVVVSGSLLSAVKCFITRQKTLKYNGINTNTVVTYTHRDKIIRSKIDVHITIESHTV